MQYTRGVLEKIARLTPDDVDNHHAMQHLPWDTNHRGVTRRKLEHGLSTQERPRLTSTRAAMLGQGTVGAGAGALLGLIAAYATGAKGSKFGKYMGIPAGIGALLAGGEAVTKKSRKRHKSYHRAEVASWKRMQDPKRRKKLIEQVLDRSKEWQE